MPSLASIATFFGLASLILASPVENLEKRSIFSIEQVAQGTVRKQGAIALSKAYEKYGKAVPEKVAAAARAAITGSVAANPEAFDSEYLCPVKVGGTTLMMDFDTGSADLWVFSNELPSSEAAGHTVYQVSSSKLKHGYSWDISYADGSGASGNVYVDKVVIGSATVTSQAVEAATSVSSEFAEDTQNDGLVGLAFSSINRVEPKAQNTWFDNIKSHLAQALFAVTLKAGQPGTYDFGHIDTSKYTGSIAYTNVSTGNGFWEFTPTGYAIGSGATKSTSIDSIADTGTTLLLLPTSIVRAYWAQVSGARYDNSQGGYIFPCSAKLPSFSLIIGGAKRTVPGSYLNYSPANTAQTCFGGLQENTGIGFSIVGDVFLKSQYVIFDKTQSSPRLGWAQQAQT